MIYNQLSTLTTIRILLLVVTTFFLMLAYIQPGFHATFLLLLLLLGAQTYELIRFVNKGNIALLKFIHAVENSDFSQTFNATQLGKNFDKINLKFNNILDKIQKEKAKHEQEFIRLKSLLEHVPIPLMSIYESGDIKLWNNSARQLFASHALTHVDDLNHYGTAFSEHIQIQPVGKTALLDINIDSITLHLSVSSIDIIQMQSRERLYSLVNIQTDIDNTQLQAWQELVKVLNHEIMNSITPIASMANSSVTIVQMIRESVEALSISTTHQQLHESTQVKRQLQEHLDDIDVAVNTLANRSNGLKAFLKNYTQLTHTPKPVKSNIGITELIERTILFFNQSNNIPPITVTQKIEPSNLSVFADAGMIEHVLLNLLKNSVHALNGIDHGHITIHAFINMRGQSIIEVSDNGPGIPEDIRSKIFIPFYTTKREGSGVGLALSKQIMQAHNGNIMLSNLAKTTFILVF